MHQKKIQNAPFRWRKCQNFSGEGHSPLPGRGTAHSPDPTPTGEGDTPVDAFGASIRVPSALDPLQTTFLDTGLRLDIDLHRTIVLVQIFDTHTSNYMTEFHLAASRRIQLTSQCTRSVDSLIISAK